MEGRKVEVYEAAMEWDSVENDTAVMLWDVYGVRDNTKERRKDGICVVLAAMELRYKDDASSVWSDEKWSPRWGGAWAAKWIETLP